ncbi:transposase [Catalinimonas niigatensis]|uniref:transposase n=1 Tax=Catalinimonas niigatensis TaxID=1397264 RepID=UPI002666740C|nr:transposase [Catalinimonas niigatensis]WPP49584.1 transposase [Catalinimonas niigatensis]WPP50051.1 transposase [Catalinimonas niigatensis]WPP50779.1 transposase [Catalinimonas niigatensis]WPP53051.1 transposase [Catalinimonas niigatensis]
MKSNLRSIRKHRCYSQEFKRQIVKEFESGKYSVVQLERLYGIHNQSIYDWIYKYSNFNEKGYRIVEKKASSTLKVKALEARIKELEGIVGRKQISIEYLEKMIDLAKDELGIDIKKNYNTQPSTGSGNSKKGGSA